MDPSAGDSNGNSSQLSSSATGDKKRKKLSHDGVTTSGVQSTAVANYAVPAPAPGIQGGPQFSMPHNAMHPNPMFSYYTQQPYFNFAAAPYIQQQNSMSSSSQQLSQSTANAAPTPNSVLEDSTAAPSEPTDRAVPASSSAVQAQTTSSPPSLANVPNSTDGMPIAEISVPPPNQSALPPAGSSNSVNPAKDSSSGGGSTNDNTSDGGSSNGLLSSEVEALRETGKSASQCYKSHLAGTNKPRDLGLLRSMLTGAIPQDDPQIVLMEEFVSKGWISKSEVKVTRDMLKCELTRRFEIAVELEDDSSRKKPPLSGSLAQLEERLANVSTSASKTTYPLKYESEKRWIKWKIKKILSSVSTEQEMLDVERMQNGDHLRKGTVLKLRLIHCKLLHECLLNVC